MSWTCGFQEDIFPEYFERYSCLLKKVIGYAPLKWKYTISINLGAETSYVDFYYLLFSREALSSERNVAYLTSLEYRVSFLPKDA